MIVLVVDLNPNRGKAFFLCEVCMLVGALVAPTIKNMYTRSILQSVPRPRHLFRI